MVDINCGDGWSGAAGDFGVFCYKMKYEKEDWEGAVAACQNLGGDLFSVGNAYEEQFLKMYIKTNAWIGYRDKSATGTWTWSDGTQGVYTNWEGESRDVSGMKRDCVVLDASEGKWRDASCMSKAKYLCKKKGEGEHKTSNDSRKYPCTDE